MRIADAFLKVVVFVGYRDDTTDRDVIGGTGFFVASDGARVVVTAQHVINAIVAAAPGSPVALWLNSPDGIVRVDTHADDWIGHPDDPSIDVAVLRTPLEAGKSPDHYSILMETFATDGFLEEYEVGIGDALYFPGLFVSHRGRERLRPIVRQGTIAAMPDEPVKTVLGPIDAYLAEVRSFGGLSGSPVFVWMNDLWRIVPGGRDEVREAHADVFLGLVHGHFDLDAVNMGISIVVPAQKIREAIEQPEVQEVVRKRAKDKEALEGEPVMDANFAADTSEFGRLENLTSGLLRVSKAELDAKLREEKEGRA